MPADVFCTKCGEPLRAEFCGVCGTKAGTTGSPDGEAASTPPPPVPAGPTPAIGFTRNQWIYGGCTLVVVLMVLVSASRNEGAGGAVILFDGLLSPVALIAIGTMVVRRIFFSGGRPSFNATVWGALSLALVVGILLIFFGAEYPHVGLECFRDSQSCTWNGIQVGGYRQERYSVAYDRAATSVTALFVTIGTLIALVSAAAMLVRLWSSGALEWNHDLEDDDELET
jgi:hypothetical protein